MRTIEALLFDLGGVIIDIDFGRVFSRWAALSPLSAEQIAERFVFGDLYHRYERGEIGDREYFDSVREALRSDADDARVLEAWNAVFTGPNRVNLALVNRLSAQMPVFAFTNTSASHQRAWSRAYPDVVAAFRRIFASAEMGMRKPERRAFDAVIEMIGADPDAILFFDDLPSNVAGARDAGLQAILVDGPDAVRNGLTAHGLV
ncbi:MAG: HAD family phosphatase [Chromatiaceae bacterium]|nr:HAD family phosphatase [Gammaproteobacteria bacterium]MCP5300454.1 HAD family phosphatase [Chromatiaceae bacterium]MCP5422526.1 HAD family phosphatase [Chromatiaceae bacterium]